MAAEATGFVSSLSGLIQRAGMGYSEPSPGSASRNCGKGCKVAEAGDRMVRVTGDHWLAQG
jgi:hypothetical protein